MIQEALDGKDLEAMAVEGVGAVTATVAGIMVVVGRRGSVGSSKMDGWT